MLEIQDNTQKNITLPISRGKNPVHRLISIYGTLFLHRYGFGIKSGQWASLGGVFKNLLKDYTEIQIAWLLITFFNWEGMNDNDVREREWLEKNAHGIYQFKGGISKYELYIRNVSGYGKEFDNDEELLKLVGNWIAEITKT